MPRTSPGRLPSPRVVLIVGFLVAALVAVLLAVLLTRGDNGRPRSGGSATRSAPGSPAPTGSLPTPVATPPVPSFTPSGAPSAAEAALLAGRHGFGRNVTGGAGGARTVVSTTADSGSGSLREALSGSSPRWITFARDMTIRLAKPLAVGSNKTIDGRGHRVEITAPGLEGLDVIGSSNVIIESLVLHDFGDVTKTADNNQPDAIHIDHSRGVWVDHNDLSMAGDKLLVVQNGSTGVTVSWNHFHDQEQTFQIGSQSTGKLDALQATTVDHNYFDRTGYRNPVASYGRVHVYNNYYYDWKLYAVRVERAGEMFLQNNVFKAGSNPRAALVQPGGDGCNDKRTHCDPRNGNLKASGNLFLDGATIKRGFTKGAADVFSPGDFYKYTAQTATAALAQTIAREAGPQS